MVKALSPDSDKMANEFHSILELFMSRSYEWKKVRRKSSDKLWMTDGIRAQVKKKKKIFKAYGRNEV